MQASLLAQISQPSDFRSFSPAQLEQLAQPLLKSGYGRYLQQLLEEPSGEHALLQRNLEGHSSEISHAR